MERTYRNVNEAFHGLVEEIHRGTILTDTLPSRAGEVLVINEPVLITYQNPWERVLFNPVRDANPFFHLYESLWMLAGRRDIAPLNYYSSNYSKFVQDGDSPNANGAYGYRWRSEWGRQADQLLVLANHLKRKPESRRAVLSMWNVEDDLYRIDSSNDVCCNTHVYFSIETGPCKACNGVGTGYRLMDRDDDPTVCEVCGGFSSDRPRYLNMTVCNRSNDLILGMLGANVVHFSFLQEYLAARIGVGIDMGRYCQFTNNLHAYTSRWEPEEWLSGKELSINKSNQGAYSVPSTCPEISLVKNPDVFDREVQEFVERHKQDSIAGAYTEPFLEEVAQPMCIAFHYHKRRDYRSALALARQVTSEDWRIASTEWIIRRHCNWEKTNDRLAKEMGTGRSKPGMSGEPGDAAE